ncbi:MAG: putative signal transducing protein [Caulobacterales bacterium]
MALAVVTRLPTLVEAQIAAGALRSAGIDAEVFDGNFGQVESPVIEALGGFRIMAPEEKQAEAQDILRALQAGPGLGEPDEGPWTTSPRRSRWRWCVWSGVALVLIVVWLARAVGLWK